MFKKAQLKIAMTRNGNGSKKKKPFLWEPTKPCSIPVEGDGMDHGRPMVVLEGTHMSENLILVFYRDRVVSQDADGNEAVLLPVQSGLGDRDVSQ